MSNLSTFNIQSDNSFAGRARTWLTEKRLVFLKAVFGEMLCTFLFIFVVLSTQMNIVRSHSDSSGITGGVSTAFVAVALIYSFADVSGAHFNPAVTFATMVTRKTSVTKGLAYIGAQLFAAIFATLFLYIVFPSDSGVVDKVVVTIYEDSNMGHAFATEFILTFILVYVIFAVAFDTVDTSNRVQVEVPDEEGGRANPQPMQVNRSVARNLTIYTTTGSSKAGFAPIAIGFTLGFLCFIGGSTSGGAFNPARVFGPSLVGNNWDNHWVYWLGDFMGAAAAGFMQSMFSHKPTSTALQNSSVSQPSSA